MNVIHLIKRNWKTSLAPDQTNGACCPVCGEMGNGLHEIPATVGELKCNNCGCTGDVISFHMKMTGCSFSDAVKQLADGLADQDDIFRTISENKDLALLYEFYSHIQGDNFRPLKTGIDFWDKLLDGGFRRQSLTFLLAAPGAGKTTLCQQIAEAVAEEVGTVYFLSFEMSNEQMLAKALSHRLAKKGKFYSLTEIMEGYSWTNEARADITTELMQYQKTSFNHIKYSPSGSSSDLKRLLEFLENEGKATTERGENAPAIFLDYLHLISSSEISDVKEMLKQAVTGLKEYAKKYNTFVVAIAANNRNTNKDGQISLSSARDSSSIEYGADCQLSLNYYEVDQGYVNPNDAKDMGKLMTASERKMIIRVQKSRFSTPGKHCKVWFDAKHNTFTSEDGFRPFDIKSNPFDEMSKELKNSK